MSEFDERLNGEQRAILRVIGEYRQRTGISPSLKEIAELVGQRSMGTLHADIEVLEKLGYLRRIKNVARSLVLQEKATHEWG